MPARPFSLPRDRPLEDESKKLRGATRRFLASARPLHGSESRTVIGSLRARLYRFKDLFSIFLRDFNDAPVHSNHAPRIIPSPLRSARRLISRPKEGRPPRTPPVRWSNSICLLPPPPIIDHRDNRVCHKGVGLHYIFRAKLRSERIEAFVLSLCSRSMSRLIW